MLYSKSQKIALACSLLFFSAAGLAASHSSPNYMITYQKYEKKPFMVKLDNGSLMPMNGYYIENAKVPDSYKTIVAKDCATTADGKEVYLLSINSGKGEMLFCESSKKPLNIATLDFLKNR